MTYALVKYSKGYTTVGTPGDDEIGVDHGDYTDLASVTVVVEAEIAKATDDASTVAITGTVIPGVGGGLYEDENLGDGAYVPDMDEAHNLERLRSITITEDGLGVVKRQAEWNSLAEEDALRRQRQLDLWTPGSLSGRSDAVSPVSLGGPSSFGEMSSGTVTSFSNGGYLVAEIDPSDSQDPGHSQWQLVTQDCVAFAVTWTLEGADPDNGVVIGVRHRTADLLSTYDVLYPISANCTAPAANTESSINRTAQGFYTNEVFLNGEFAQIFIYSTGFFSSGIAIDLKSTSLY